MLFPSWRTRLIVMAIVALTANRSLPAAGPGGPPMEPQPLEIAGSVEGFNLNIDRGTPNGILLILPDGRRVQVNLPDANGETIAKNIAIGDVIQAAVLPEGGEPGRGGPEDGRGRSGRGGEPAPNGPDGRGGPPPQAPPDHPAFRMLLLRDARGQIYQAPEGPGGPGGRGADATLRGRVRVFNYDRRGAVNGVQLVSGDFVKLPNMAGMPIALRIGDEIAVEGPSRAIPNSKATVIDAKILNGINIRPAPPAPPARGGRGEPPDGRGRGPNGPEDAGARGRGGPPAPPPPEHDDAPESGPPIPPPPPHDDFGPEPDDFGPPETPPQMQPFPQEDPDGEEEFE